jgi:hypothetical protein
LSKTPVLGLFWRNTFVSLQWPTVGSGECIGARRYQNKKSISTEMLFALIGWLASKDGER